MDEIRLRDDDDGWCALGSGMDMMGKLARTPMEYVVQNICPAFLIHRANPRAVAHGDIGNYELGRIWLWCGCKERKSLSANFGRN